jgi:hypothetical protein
MFCDTAETAGVDTEEDTDDAEELVSGTTLAAVTKAAGLRSVVDDAEELVSGTMLAAVTKSCSKAAGVELRSVVDDEEVLPSVTTVEPAGVDDAVEESKTLEDLVGGDAVGDAAKTEPMVPAVEKSIKVEGVEELLRGAEGLVEGVAVVDESETMVLLSGSRTTGCAGRTCPSAGRTWAGAGEADAGANEKLSEVLKVDGSGSQRMLLQG